MTHTRTNTPPHQSSKKTGRTATTIKDVALLARCSIATVSRALNTPAKVDPATLAAVQAAIDATDYRPSALGRMLRAAHSQVIGVIVPTIANPVFGETVQGIDELASAAGYRVMLMTTEYRTDREHTAIDTLRAHHVDGLIVTVADARANDALDALDLADMPYVLAHNDAPANSQRRSVAVDNFTAAREAVEQMIARGHTRIRMLAGTLSASDRALQRVAGYEAAMRTAGLTVAPVIEIDFLSDHLSMDVMRALARSETTALFCSNDRLAIVAITSLETQGLSVPGDISVVGFDGLTLGALSMPRLTSVCVPNREIGRRAWASLREAIRGGHKAKQETMPPSIPGTVPFEQSAQALSHPSMALPASNGTSGSNDVHQRLPHALRLGGTLGTVTERRTRWNCLEDTPARPSL
ncbi:LacI family DNA-binding transcriptional regulator [Robbsia andropogonis]|uniref:LacI family DNA-binding transcriptional regulator n=1 Tax=Robbsia andropogonis TaxID=28092 RepID=UPI002A6A4FDE|nr:LacI family DNA-binding transcriptional regulator [Robbsia andropogonis]